MSTKQFTVGLAVNQAKRYDRQFCCQPPCLNMSLICLSAKVISGLGVFLSDIQRRFILDEASHLLFYESIYSLFPFCYKYSFVI